MKILDVALHSFSNLQTGLKRSDFKGNSFLPTLEGSILLQKKPSAGNVRALCV